jgi:hypothetical protein
VLPTGKFTRFHFLAKLLDEPLHVKRPSRINDAALHSFHRKRRRVMPVPESHASGTIHKDMLRGVFGATYASQSAGVF